MGIFDGKLILTDLDGTLLNRKAEVSAENLDAIRRFMAQGGRFSVATGRSMAGMRHFLEHLPINAPAVIYNGSVVYDFGRDEPICQSPVGEIGAELARAVAERFPDVGIEVYDLHRPYIVQENDITRRHFAHTKMPWNACRAEDIPQPWLNLLLTREEERMPELRAFIEEHFAGEFFLQLSMPYFLEVEHRTANKGAAALRLRDALGIAPEDLYVIGDGTNDVELVSCTERRCAPANACAEIMALHPHLLPDCDCHVLAALINEIEQGVI